MSKLQLRMIVPGAAPLEREADEVTLVGSDGVFTILPNHAALLSRLTPGVARIAVVVRRSLRGVTACVRSSTTK